LKIIVSLLLFLSFAAYSQQPGTSFVAGDISDTATCQLLLEQYDKAESAQRLKLLPVLQDICEQRLKYTSGNEQLKRYYLETLVFALNERSVACRDKGDIARSLEYLYRCLGINQQLGRKRAAAISCNNLGALYNDIGDVEKAEEFFTRSLNYFDPIANACERATIQSHLGFIHYKKKNVQKASDYYKQALSGFLACNDSVNIVSVYNGLGLIDLDRGHYSSALDYFEKSLRLSINNGDEKAMASALGNLGDYYFTRKDYSKALRYSGEALETGKRIGNVVRMRNASKVLYKVYRELKQYDRAVEMQDLYIRMKDSVQNENLRKEAQKKQLQYEFEKKALRLYEDQELQNALLAQERKYQWLVAIISAVVVLLLLSLLYLRYRYRKAREKQALLLRIKEAEIKAGQAQMNPHFIFNSLNSILEFVRTSQKEDAIHYLNKFSKLIRTVLESSHQRTILLSDEITLLTLYLELENMRFDSGFRFSFTIDEQLDPETAEIPAMILQPFVENAVLHGLQNREKISKKNGQPYTGAISISLEKKESYLHCSIRDNGIGREMAQQIKEQRTFGHFSIGMRITDERLRWLDAKNCKATYTDLKDEQGQAIGTIVEVLVPLTEQF
jgi:tetratricopeptide (TPR) repeat protein